MTDLIALFDDHERALLLSPAIARFTVIKRRVIEREGFSRVRAELASGGLLEFSEYWRETSGSEIARGEYTYHWQNSSGSLVSRWDSAKHHPSLPHAPHHAHRADGTTEGDPQPPTLQSVLRDIESVEQE